MKEKIEKELKEMLWETLRGINQEGGLISLKLDDELDEFNETTCTVKMRVWVDEEGEAYFDGY